MKGIKDKLGELDKLSPLNGLAQTPHDNSLLKKRYLTVEEVSIILRITQGTFRSWVSRKIVPFPIIKLGKRILVDEDDLREYLASAKQSFRKMKEAKKN